MVQKFITVVKYILLLSISLFFFFHLASTIDMHTYLFVLSFLVVFIAYRLLKNNHFSAKDTTHNSRYKARRYLKVIYLLLCLLMILMLLNNYRWDIQQPYYVENAYDDYWIERIERDRWLDETWYRAYTFNEKSDMAYLVEYLQSSKNGVSSMSSDRLNYEAKCNRLSLINKPYFIIERTYVYSYEIEKEKRSNRILLSIIWDALALFILVSIGLMYLFYRWNKQNEKYDLPPENQSRI